MSESLPVVPEAMPPQRFGTPLVLVGLAVLVLVVLAIFFFRGPNLKEAISEFELTPTSADASGIAAESQFVLKSTVDLSEAVIEKHLRFDPPIEFAVEKTEVPGTFAIIPRTLLDVNKIYTAAIEESGIASHAFSWAYQVKAPFQIVSSVPAHRGTGVPTNTGIEIDFNREDIIDPQMFIEISPSVAGRFEVVGSKVRFIPHNPLSERTLYSVRVKPGLKSKNSTDTLLEEKVIDFETVEAYTGKQTPFISFSRLFSEFKPSEPIVFSMNASQIVDAPLEIYTFNTVEEYLAAVNGDTTAGWTRYSKKSTNTVEKGTKIMTVTVPIERVDSSYYQYIRLPQTLPVGFYGVSVSTGKLKTFAWFQVNPVVSLSAYASKQSMIWLKDIVTGNAIGNVPIIYKGKVVGQTGTDGVATFTTPSELLRSSYTQYTPEARQFFTATIPTGTLVIPFENEYGGEAYLGQPERWWDYVSLNKNIYLPTDTLHFWSIIKAREGQSKNEEIQVRLTNSYWDVNSENVVTYGETTVKLSDYNAVTGKILFNNLKPGLYDLTFRTGDEIITKQTVTVAAYAVPAYEITVTPDKKAVFAGDPVKFTIKAAFFDGTPVGSTLLAYTTYGFKEGSSKSNILLNELGQVEVTLVPQYTETPYSSWPTYANFRVTPVNSEEGNIEASTYVMVFGPRIFNTVAERQTGTATSFDIETRAIAFDPQGVNYYGDMGSYAGGKAIGAITQIEVSEVIYTRVEQGSGYDPIHKLTYPRYYYNTTYKPLSTQTVVSDAAGMARYSFAPEAKKTYKVVFTTRDNGGRKDEDTRYVYGNDPAYANPYSTNGEYRLFNIHNKSTSKIGEPITLKLQSAEGVLPQSKSNGFIFVVTRNGLIEYHIQDSPIYMHTFQDVDVPNIGVWPAWFEEGRFHTSYVENISFDAQERNLTIDVIKDKQVYKPGDMVVLDLKVTDKNKRPVRAEINISALDEAVFSLNREEKDVINDLYRDIYGQFIFRASNEPPYGGGGAEKGGGGDGDTPRSDIQEIALFRSVETDGGGSARVEFKLPDNITSWRITSQAVTSDLYAGKSVDFVAVTLPFFVDMTLNNTYLSGDEILLRTRVFGTSLTSNVVRYSLESSTLPFKKIEQTAGRSIETPVGALTLGIHQVTVRAEAGGYKDALTRPIRVLDSYFTKESADFYEGTAGLTISNKALGDTTLSFGSFGRGKLYNELTSLSCGCGLRVDQKGAAMVATRLLNTYFQEENEVPEFIPSKYQNSQGAIQLLPYSSDDLELSAVAAHVFPLGTFDSQSLKNYFYASLQDTKADTSRIVRALYGLSAFKEPILTKLQTIQSDKSLSLKDKVFIALSLASLGATEEARVYYRIALSSHIETNGPSASVTNLKGDDTSTVTMLLAALAARLDLPEAEKFAYFAIDNPPKETLHSFEHLLYLEEALPKLDPEEVSFTYALAGKEVTKTLKDGEIHRVRIILDQLTTFALQSVTGKLGISSVYETSTNPETLRKDPNLSLSRRYSVDERTTQEFKEGDLVKVYLIPQIGTRALGGYYEIIDHLPSGLRAVDQESSIYWTDYRRVSPREINDQKVTFVVERLTNLPVYYFARVVSKGTYKAEPALLQSVRNPENLTLSNEETVRIK